MVDITTPARRKVANLDKPITSPYFTQLDTSTPNVKRKRLNSSEEPPIHSTPGRVATIQHEMHLTTSPYFSDARTPSPRHIVTSPNAETERESGAEKIPRMKKQRLIVRGETPDEPLPPPATPGELSEALRRIKPSLVQESVQDDPWKIIVATTLLNKTSGRAAVPVFWKLLERWPTPGALAQAAAPILTKLLRPLGTQSVRTSRLIRISNTYVMHPPVLLPQTQLIDKDKSTQSPPYPPGTLSPTHTQSSKEYTKTQKSSPIAHLPFTGPYAIDSFRIFSSSLPGGGAPCRVEEQLKRIASLPRFGRRPPADDFDETPEWYDPSTLRVFGDEGAEWRQVRPADKELRRYLVWRWAIEGIAYDSEKQTFMPANWTFMNELIRR